MSRATSRGSAHPPAPPSPPAPSPPAPRTPSPRRPNDSRIANRAEVLYETDRTRIVRRRLGQPDPHTVIAKEYLGPGAGARLRQERSVLARLTTVAGVPHLRPELADSPDALVETDAGSVRLADRILPGGWPTDRLLGLAVDLAGTVAAIHRAGVIHRDVNPSNIVLEEPSGRPVLIDFDHATTWGQDRPASGADNVSGTLPYLAPEQTGRTGREVDHRADLYGIGATLYEVACGRLPFTAEDPLALVHAHLARVPEPLHRLNPAIPPALSRIIARLLEKEPEERYQSAEGLAHDLSRLGMDLGQGRPCNWRLGERDFPSRLAPPSRLVGRDAEIAELDRALAEALDPATDAQGAAEPQEATDTRVATEPGGATGTEDPGGRRPATRHGGLLVRGRTGVGKTALVEQLRARVAEGDGWFVSGRADRHHRELPATATAQALRALGRLLLAEQEDDLAPQRTRILQALGPNTELVVTLPEFALLFRTPPRAPESMDSCTRGRLARAWADLLLAVASPQRPVVLVLDDLQWASHADLDVVDLLLTEDRPPGLLVVGAFRDDAIDPAHPLAALLARWEDLGRCPTTLQLADLPRPELADFLGGMLRLPPDRCGPLAEVIGARTEGNPLETVELVNALRRDGILWACDRGWQWDAGQIRRYIGSGDVGALVVTRLARLPSRTRELLADLACLGGKSTLDRLGTASGLTAEQLRERLSPALDEGLVVSCDAETAAAHDGAAVRLCHDRVRQAALAGLSVRQVHGLHLGLARRLSASGTADAQVADQYLHVWATLDDPAERHRVADVFRSAATDVRVVNPGLAERLLAAAASLLAGLPAGTDDDLVLAVAADRHAVLYELGRLDDADELYTVLERRCTDPMELVDPACVQIASLTNRSRAGAAVGLGLDLLRRLEVPIPADIQSSIYHRLDAAAAWVAENADGCAAAPELTDPRLLAVARVIHRMLAPALVANPYTYPWLVLTAQQLWAEHGPSRALLSSAAGAPAFLIAMQEDFPTAYALADLTLKVGRGFGWEPSTSIVRCQFATGVGHWFEPLEDQLGPARQSQDDLVRSGEPHYAAMTYHALLPALLDRGPTLDTCDAEVEAALALAARIGSRYDEGLVLSYGQLLRALRGETDQPGGFDDATFSEAAYLADPQVTPMARAVFHVNRALAAALFARPAELARHAAEAMRKLAFVPGYYVTALAYLTQALALAERLRTDGDTPSGDTLAELDVCRDWLAGRAVDAPHNFAHLAHLVDAERAWALGDSWAAARGFDRALGKASARDRPWHHAFIAERGGTFLLDQGLTLAGRDQVRRARDAYGSWGATAKVAQLEARFPWLRSTPGRHEGRSASVPSRAVSGSADAVDLLGVLKASQAIGRETSLDRLRDRLVEVVGELAGATDVRILLRAADAYDWALLGSRSAGGASLPLAEAGAHGLVPLSAVRFTERTLEPLLVPDAARDPRFAKDPFLTGIEHCSLMVVPILSHGEPRAMLVLENRLSSDVFTPARLGAVGLIAGQLAVSLDNALAERFRSLVRRSSDATLVCGRDGTVSYASPAAAELMGLTDDALGGRPVQTLIHPHDQEAVLARIAATGPSQPEPAGSEALQCRTTHADGGHRWVEVTFTDLTGDPAVAGVVLLLRDVTERRRLETELRHAHKMESVGQLAAGLAHEINTPIQFVGDNLRYLTEAFTDFGRVLEAYRASPCAGGGTVDPDRLAAEVDLDYLLEDVPAALAQTRDGVDRVAAIVRAMKASVHPGDDVKAPVPLNEVVQSTLIIAANEIKYVADVELDLAELPDVWCDRGDINQVLLNLVINAAQAIAESVAAGGERGTLTVRTRHEGEEVVIEVRDSGPGIPPEVADRVFEPFFTTKPVGKGTGQGLSLAYFLVHDRHGGSITFTSQPGYGTTFTVRLPVNPTTVAAGRPGPGTQP